jgi:hypothetical protein
MSPDRLDHYQLFNQGALRKGAELAVILRDAVVTPEIAQFSIETIIEHHSLAASEGDSIYNTMKTLEEIAETSEPLACILMSYLWIIASRRRIHDVSDSIDLWLSNCKSVELRQHLLILASNQSDAGIRQHLERLAV